MRRDSRTVAFIVYAGIYSHSIVAGGLPLMS